MINRSLKGFTLVEIMIVVVIIAVILAIATPNYLKSNKTSQKTVCIANLEKIDSAIDQWTIETHTPAGSSIDEEAVYNDYVKSGRPRCPSGGEYTFHMVGDSPQVTCSKEDEGHKLN